jgi:hypothetical protein
MVSEIKNITSQKVDDNVRFCISNIILASIEYLVKSDNLLDVINFDYITEYLNDRYSYKKDNTIKIINELKALLQSDNFKKLFNTKDFRDLYQSDEVQTTMECFDFTILYEANQSINIQIKDMFKQMLSEQKIEELLDNNENLEVRRYELFLEIFRNGIKSGKIITLKKMFNIIDKLTIDGINIRNSNIRFKLLGKKFELDLDFLKDKNIEQYYSDLKMDEILYPHTISTEMSNLYAKCLSFKMQTREVALIQFYIFTRFYAILNSHYKQIIQDNTEFHIMMINKYPNFDNLDLEKFYRCFIELSPLELLNIIIFKDYNYFLIECMKIEDSDRFSKQMEEKDTTIQQLVSKLSSNKEILPWDYSLIGAALTSIIDQYYDKYKIKIQFKPLILKLNEKFLDHKGKSFIAENIQNNFRAQCENKDKSELYENAQIITNYLLKYLNIYPLSLS